MTIITANKTHLKGKILFLIVLSVLILLFVSLTINPGGNNFSIGGNTRLIPIGMIIFLILIASTIVLQLISVPVGIDIIDLTNEIVLRFFFSRSLSVSLSDIISYHPTKISTRAQSYNGIILHLASGKMFLLSNFNLTDYTPVKLFLDEAGVTNMGYKKFGFFSYITQNFG